MGIISRESPMQKPHRLSKRVCLLVERVGLQTGHVWPQKCVIDPTLDAMFSEQRGT